MCLNCGKERNYTQKRPGLTNFVLNRMSLKVCVRTCGLWTVEKAPFCDERTYYCETMQDKPLSGKGLIFIQRRIPHFNKEQQTLPKEKKRQIERLRGHGQFSLSYQTRFESHLPIKRLWIRKAHPGQTDYECGVPHSTVDLSLPSILPPRVWVPSTPSRLLSIYIWIVSCRKGRKLTKIGRDWPNF